MLYALNGIVVEKNRNIVVIDVNGIMFKVIVPLSSLSKLPDINNRAHLFTELVLGENVVNLYGFCTKAERDLFNELRKVSKIGAKTAISALSALSVDRLYRAIDDKDDRTLAMIPGIGRKTALSIIVQLSGKMPKSENTIVSDAVETLSNLGFNKSASLKLVNEIYAQDPSISLEMLIKESLKRSMKKNGS